MPEMPFVCVYRPLFIQAKNGVVVGSVNGAIKDVTEMLRDIQVTTVPSGAGERKTETQYCSRLNIDSE